MSEVNIELLSHQKKFMQSSVPITIMIAGRASGKSFVAGLKIAILLANGYSVIFMSQNYRMVKKVMVKAIEDALILIGLPYEKNISDMTIKVGVATAHGFSSESVESIRGLTNIKALIIDEAALCGKDTLDIASACLRGQGSPEIYLISTPRGKGNYLNSLMQDEDNCVIRATTYENSFLDKSFISLLESQYDEQFAKQELLGEILDADEPNQLISTEKLNNATGSIESNTNWKYCIGLDCARFGNDSTCLVVRHGKNLVDIEKLPKSDTMQIVNLVRKYERKYGKDNISSIAIDTTGGFGAGPYDILKETNNNIIAVEFGSKSPEEYYNNYRTYMYHLVQKYLAEGGMIGSDANLYIELLSQEFILNTNGKKQLVPKENIKQKIGRSPDTSDAFVLSLVTKGDMFIAVNKEMVAISAQQERLRLRALQRSSVWHND